MGIGGGGGGGGGGGRIFYHQIIEIHFNFCGGWVDGACNSLITNKMC